MKKSITALPENLKRIFIKDNKFPIHLIEEPQFQYLLSLYEPWIKTRTKYEQLLDCIAAFDNLELYEADKKSYKPRIAEILEKSEAKQELTKDIKEIDKQYPLPQHNFPSVNVFHRQYVGSKLLSLDMVKANWQIWRLLGLVEKTVEYKDWIKSLGGNDYLADSKMLRQALFGEIEPKRVQRIQKSLSLKIASALQKEKMDIITLSADELVINFDKMLAPEETLASRPDILARIQNVLTQETPDIQWRAQEWNLKPILLEKDWLLQESKELIDGTPQSRGIDFRNVPQFFLPQVMKAYRGEELEAQDLYFDHMGYQASFNQPVDLSEFRAAQRTELANKTIPLSEPIKFKPRF